ncbi:hypothetical protein EJ06DRAFT_173438 [Trichodelitschia bisporula]|uniref:Uncharacterized protein n=1 Tax=Trichodelitschia bisporula TaxID=703511 RepID=A0A6G1HLF9_9PEZI|nr:hypothetical protein EJ06DRAFT_173438 [Trichodelitschia bisporula]
MHVMHPLTYGSHRHTNHESPATSPHIGSTRTPIPAPIPTPNTTIALALRISAGTHHLCRNTSRGSPNQTIHNQHMPKFAQRTSIHFPYPAQPLSPRLSSRLCKSRSPIQPSAAAPTSSVSPVLHPQSGARGKSGQCGE